MNHLYFTKKERRALVLIISLICMSQIASAFMNWMKWNQELDQTEIVVNYHPILVDSIGQNLVEDPAIKKVQLITDIKEEVKDPLPIELGSLTEEMLTSHDLPAPLIKTWLKFHQKGMRFYSADDIHKIYGMTPQIFERIQAYLVYAKRENTTASSQRDQKQLFKQNLIEQPISINTASAKELTHLKGVGEVLSKRIVKFRDLVGGFHSLEQLYDVYGLRSTLVDSLSEKLLFTHDGIRTYNVYTSSEKELSEQFYIPNYLAKQIKELLESRYVSIDDAKTLKVQLTYDQDKLDVILPYLDFTKPIDQKN